MYDPCQVSVLIERWPLLCVPLPWLSPSIPAERGLPEPWLPLPTPPFGLAGLEVTSSHCGGFLGMAVFPVSPPLIMSLDGG